MKLKIGVMGTSNPKLPMNVRKLAYNVGKSIAQHNCILVNGASLGVPYESSKGAKKADGFVVGISPAKDIDQHVNQYKLPTDKFDLLIFSGFGYKGRNVLNISSCDGVIIVNGSYGTLNEFSIACDEGRVIGVLEGSGGIADHIREIVDICKKETGATLIYEKDVHQLVRKVIIAIRKRGTHVARRTY
jgi:hypothetical protein